MPNLENENIPTDNKALNETNIPEEENLEEGSADQVVDTLTPEQEEAHQEIIQLLSASAYNIDKVLKIKGQFNLPENLLQAAAEQGMVKLLLNYDISGALKIKESFNLPEDLIQAGAKKAMIKCLSDGEDYGASIALKIKEQFNLPDDLIQAAAREAMIINLSNDKSYRALKIKKLLNVPEDILQSPEIQASAKQKMIDYLLDGYGDLAISTKEEFHLSDDILQSPEIQDAAKKALILHLVKHHFDDARKIGEQFSLPEAEVHAAVLQELTRRLESDNIWDINNSREIIDAFPLPEAILQSQEIQAAALQGFAKCLADHDTHSINLASAIRNKFSLPEAEVQAAAFQELTARLAVDEYGVVREIGEQFSLPEAEIQTAVLRELTKELANNEIRGALQICTAFSLSRESLQSPEIQAAALEQLTECLEKGIVYIIFEIRDTFNLPEDIFQSPKVQTAAVEGIVSCLSKSDMDGVLKIKDFFNLPEQVVISAVNEWARGKQDDCHGVAVLQLPLALRQLVDPQILELIFVQETADENMDETIKNQFQYLKDNMGEARFRQLFLNHENFWQDVHDNLLFTSRLMEQPPAQASTILQLLLPLLSETTDFQQLNELLGYFSLDVYQEKCGGKPTPFVNFEHFAREANLQRYNIKIPENASDNFRDAIGHMITIRGVDVQFLRRLCDLYNRENIATDDLAGSAKNQTEDNEDIFDDDNNSESELDSNIFAQQIIDILEGRDKINERKLIRPFSETISFDPLNKVVFNAIGFYSLNNLTPKTAEYLADPNGLGAILRLFEKRDQELKDEIEADKNQRISQHPEKRNRYLAEAQKRIKAETMVLYSDANKPGSVNIENISNISDLQFRLGEDQMEIICQALQNAAYNSEGFQSLAVNALSSLGQRSDNLDNVFELAAFRNLAEKAKNSFQDKSRDERQKIGPEELLSVIKGDEALFSLFLLWLSLNNQNRASQSAEIKRRLDTILNQKRYKESLENDRQTTPDTARLDVSLAYLQGKLAVETIDEENIRALLKDFGYKDIGRTLEVEIAEGSDYAAWTCGDETNCCMPFTSDKNQAYLLRNDTAYFVVKLQGQIIAQSVLVEAKDKEDGHPVTAIDNIEIANRAINYRPVIAEAYRQLREKLIRRHQNERYQIVIGTSYNDDGGTVTGDCELQPTTASPMSGKLPYSDWERHSANYIFYDSLEQNNNSERYFGLQIDMFDRNRAMALISDQEEKTTLKNILEKIGQGEDDGDGGLIFPDNYSCVIVENDQPIGYVVAADYISNDNDQDLVHIEKIKFSNALPPDKAIHYFQNYLERKKFISNEDLDGILISNTVFRENPEFVILAQEYFSGYQTKQTAEGLMLSRK